MYLIPKNIKVKREIFKGFGLSEIILMAISIGIGYILSMFINIYYLKMISFVFFPILTFLLLIPLPNGNTLLKIIKKFLKFRMKQKEYKIKWGGIKISNKKFIKWKKVNWNLEVSSYPNNRLCLKIKSKNKEIEITTDLSDLYCDKEHIFINPDVNNNGLINTLKKYKIIREVVGVTTYNYHSILIATLNMGVLRKYDFNGVSEFISNLRGDFNS